MRWIGRFIGKAVYNAFFAIFGIILIGGTITAVANYTVTQGAGTTFGSIAVATVNYAQQFVCDVVAPGTCANVKAASTAAVATDQALVVAVSPNNTLPENLTQQAGTTLGTPTAYGTAPTGNALSVNASVTNTPAVTQSGGPWTSNITQQSGTALGTPTAYGTAPTGNALSANTFVTNANPNGAAAIANSSPVTAATINVTPTDCSGTITTGGTAQNAFAAQAALHGFVIKNIDTTNSELLWISFTGAAAANTAASYGLAAPSGATSDGGSFTTPLGFGDNAALSVIAATTGHRFSCTRW